MSQYDNNKSCQPCGCDEGANHMCAACTKRAEAWDAAIDARLQQDEEADVNDARVVPSFEEAEYPDVAYYKRMHASVGIGGAPTRATTLPTEAAERKKFPMATGLLFYFPDALAAVANVSWHGNNQHNPGMPLHWDRSKSDDEADTAVRHLAQSGSLDTDGKRHTAKAAWRILALLQKEIEQEKA